MRGRGLCPGPPGHALLGRGGAVALPRIAGWSLALSVPEAGGEDGSTDGSDASAPDGDPAGSAAVARVSIEVLDRSGTVVGTTTTAVLPGRSVTLDGADLVESPADAAAVVVRSDGDVAWSVALEVPREDGDLVAVLAPVTLPAAREAVEVGLR